MWVCSGDCGQMWGAWLPACPTDGAQLREFGTDDADYDRPELSKFPLREAHAAQRFGRAPVTGAVAGGGLGAPPRPGSRSTVAEWRSWAIWAGVPQADADGAKSKGELKALADAATNEKGAA